MRTLAHKPLRADVAAGIGAGVIGLFLIVAIWTNLVFPAPIVLGGGSILTGSSISLTEHEWGFNQLAKGGPTICAVNGQNVTITLQNTGVNLHGLHIVNPARPAPGGMNNKDHPQPGDDPRIKINPKPP